MANTDSRIYQNNNGGKYKGSKKPEISTLVYGKVPPQNVEFEKAVLGACMLEMNTFEEILIVVRTAEYFYLDVHQQIFKSMVKLHAAGGAIDLLTITNQLKKDGLLELVGGAYYLTQLTMAVLSSAHAKEHALVIAEEYFKREVIRIAGSAINDAYNDGTDAFDLLNNVQGELEAVTTDAIPSLPQHISLVAGDVLKDVDRIQALSGNVTGVTTGYTSLDDATTGWQKGDLVIIAARPSVGKTAFAINLAINAARANSWVLFFSLEMPTLQISKRILSAHGGIPLKQFNSPHGFKNNTSYERLINTIKSASQLNLSIDDRSAVSPFEIRAKARLTKSKYPGLDGIIIIDYLQLMNGGNSSNSRYFNRNEEISTITRTLKQIAKELGVTVIALSQLNRDLEKRSNPRPLLSDLRESGAIEQDADQIMFLYRSDYQKTEAEVDPMMVNEAFISIAKNRNGVAPLELIMEFNKELQLWKDIDLHDDGFKPQDNPFNGFSQFQESKLFIDNQFTDTTF